MIAPSSLRFVFVFGLAFCLHASVALSEPLPKVVSIKYRNTPVDLSNARFEHKDTAGSSFVGGAWYDASNQYMVIRLSGTYYHYCRMPAATWAQFKAAESFGKTYNAAIKRRYDCREGGVPQYSPH